MIIFLYGPNSYFRSSKLGEIIQTYQEKYKDIILERFDLEKDGDYEKFARLSSSTSIFAQKKLAVLDNVFESKEKKGIKKILEANLESKENMIIAVSDGKPPQSFSFLLDKPCVSQQFSDLKRGAELNAFIKKDAEARQLSLTGEEIAILGENFGGDLWGLSTELDKLALSSRVSLRKESAEDYFQLINLFKNSKSVKDKIIFLEKMLSDRGDDPAKIFNMLGSGYTSSQLTARLADYDVMVKTGKLDYEEALLELALTN